MHRGPWHPCIALLLLPTHRELVPGWGEPAKPGDQVTVNYTALDNATEKIVECTYQSAYPLQFVVGDGYVTCCAHKL